MSLSQELAGFTLAKREVAALAEALRKASQLASIASDWNLYEVEIDGAMVGIYDLKAEFDALIAKATPMNPLPETGISIGGRDDLA